MSDDREEFEKCRRKLYALADRLGLRMAIIVRRKPNAPAPQPSRDTKRPPFEQAPKGERQPGED